MERIGEQRNIKEIRVFRLYETGSQVVLHSKLGTGLAPTSSKYLELGIELSNENLKLDQFSRRSNPIVGKNRSDCITLTTNP